MFIPNEQCLFKFGIQYTFPALPIFPIITSPPKSFEFCKKLYAAPTFILANVVLDIEPLLVLIMGLNYPLHGYLHTFIAAVVVASFSDWVCSFLKE